MYSPCTIPFKDHKKQSTLVLVEKENNRFDNAAKNSPAANKISAGKKSQKTPPTNLLIPYAIEKLVDIFPTSVFVKLRDVLIKGTETERDLRRRE